MSHSDLLDSTTKEKQLEYVTKFRTEFPCTKEEEMESYSEKQIEYIEKVLSV